MMLLHVNFFYQFTFIEDFKKLTNSILENMFRFNHVEHSWHGLRVRGCSKRKKKVIQNHPEDVLNLVQKVKLQHKNIGKNF